MSDVVLAGVNIHGDEPSPIRCIVDAGFMKIYSPWYVTVAVKRGWFWKTIYSGKRWARAGILPTSGDIGLAFPLDATVRVKARGQAWVVDIQRPMETRVRRPFRQLVRENRFIGYSAVIHAAIGIGLLLVAGSYSGGALVNQSQQASSGGGKISQSLELGRASAPASPPFLGASYKKFLRAFIDRTGTGAERLQNLVGDLGGNDKGLTISAKNAGGALGDGVLGSDLLGKRGNGVGFGVAQQLFRVARVADQDEAAVSEKDQVELKKIFNEANDDMTRVYSKSLMVDPTLAVTVAFEVTVQSSGSLKLTRFKATGKSQEQGLRSLNEGLRDIFGKLTVEKRFAGLKILGENAFVH